MPGLVPGIHVLSRGSDQRRGWPGHRRSEATPFFERLCPAMTMRMGRSQRRTITGRFLAPAVAWRSRGFWDPASFASPRSPGFGIGTRSARPVTARRPRVVELKYRRTSYGAGGGRFQGPVARGREGLAYGVSRSNLVDWRE